MQQVLIVAPGRDVKGGMTSVVVSLMKGLDLMADDLFHVRLHPTYKDKFNSIGKIIYSLIQMFAFIFKFGRYDIFHIHTSAYGSFYRKAFYVLVCNIFHKKVVFHIHSSNFEEFHNKGAINRYLIRKTLNRADAIIVLSKQMEKLAVKYCDNRNIFILNNPVSIPSDSELLGRVQDADGKIRLLFMGEIGPRKGVYDLVKVAQIMPEDILKKLIFYICGNNEIDKLKRLVEQTRIEDSFRILGWVQGEDKKALLLNSDIFILPSYHEGLPISILEAMSYSMSVISTDVGGIPEVVRQGFNGIITKPGDIEAIRDAVVKLVLDKNTRLEYGKNSRILAGEYNLDIVILKLIEIYKQI